MQLYFSLQQSHKQSSKMLIEHTSGSIEDKLETKKMVWCVTAVNRMLQPTKSPWSTNPACVTTTLKIATWSTQSQP